jgi:nuclear pore complex protein Nup133
MDDPGDVQNDRYVDKLLAGRLKANLDIDQDPESRCVLVKRIEGLLGAGGTHGELCVRFGSEDLREPIIRDNLLDDDILREHIEKNRLLDWFAAALQAGKKAYALQKAHEKHAQQQKALPFDSPDDFVELQAENEDAVIIAGSEETPGSDSFEGDIESVADQEQDIEMQDS